MSLSHPVADTPRRAPWLRGLEVIGILALGWVGQHLALRHQLQYHWDFPHFYDAAAQLHQAPARRLEAVSSQFPYPGTFLLAISPLTHLPLPAAIRVWYWINFGALLAAIGLAYRLLGVEIGSSRRRLWVLAGAILICLNFLELDLKHGQTNILVLALILAAIWLERRGREAVPGALLGAAMAIKLTPLLWAVYYLARRRPRVVAWMVGVFLLLAAVAPEVGIARGADASYVHHLAWVLTRKSSAVPGPQIDFLLNRLNVSLLGLIERSFSHVDVNWRIEAPQYVNVLNLPERTTRELWLTVVALWVAGLAVWVWRDRKGSEWMLQTGMVLVSMLALSPLTEKPHLVLLLWPWAVALDRVSGAGRDRVLGGLLAAALLVQALNVNHAWWPYSLLTYYTLGIALALVWAGWRRVGRVKGEVAGPAQRAGFPLQ